MHDAGDLTTAAATCERAHRLDPSAPEPLLELASILGEMGEPDLSIAAYRAILKTSPANADAHYGLGRSYLNRGQHDLALTEFQAALRSNPKDPRLYKAVGVASGMLGAHAEAQRVFRDGLLIAPEDTALRNNLGLSLVQSGRYDQGLLILEALAKNPNAEQASHDNLLMAQGLATAARAEIMLAEAEAEAEALAKAEDLEAAQAATQAQPKPEDQAEVAAGNPDKPDAVASTPAILVSYPQSSWPMDGPGEDSVALIGDLASMPTPNKARRDLIARALTKRPDSGAVAAPTPLTKAMAPRSTSNLQQARPARPTAKTGTPVVQAPRSLTSPQSRKSPMNRQTARADFGDASDAGSATANNLDMTAPSRNRPRMMPTPSQLATKPPRPREPSAAKSGRDTYTVQFASYTSEERAWRGWDSLRGTASGLLNNIKPDVRRADLGGDMGTVYRLRTEPAPILNAKTLCSALKAEGVECLVVKSEPKVAEGTAVKSPATL